MLLVLISPDESFGKNIVALVNKALIIAYKATNNYWLYFRTGVSKLGTTAREVILILSGLQGHFIRLHRHFVNKLKTIYLRNIF